MLALVGWLIFKISYLSISEPFSNKQFTLKKGISYKIACRVKSKRFLIFFQLDFSQFLCLFFLKHSVFTRDQHNAFYNILQTFNVNTLNLFIPFHSMAHHILLILGPAVSHIQVICPSLKESLPLHSMPDKYFRVFAILIKVCCIVFSLFSRALTLLFSSPFSLFLFKGISRS